MIRNWEFARKDRTKATADHFGRLLSEIRQDGGKVRELRGTVFISFPDSEFAFNESPLLNSEVRHFLRELFSAVPELLYYLSDVREAVSLQLCAAAFCPESLSRGKGDQVNLAVTPQFLTVLAQLLVVASHLAAEVGQSPEIVLTHASQLGPDIYQAMRDLVT